MFPLKAAQQERPGDKVPAVRGVRPVGHEFHVLALAVADQHDPLGQIAPGLDGSAHNLLKGFQRVLHLGGAGSLAGFYHQNVDFVCHTENPPSSVRLLYSSGVLGQIVTDQGCVILADGCGRVVERRQGVRLDVLHQRGVLAQAVQNVGDMLMGELQEPALDHAANQRSVCGRERRSSAARDAELATARVGGRMDGSVSFSSVFFFSVLLGAEKPPS